MTDRVRVWDLPVRLVHWLLLVCVVGAWVSVEVFEDLDWHQRFGLGILGLLLFRIAWGFLGSTTARFGSFLRSPAAALAYLGAWRRREAPKYTGHNPLGAWSAVAMLLALLVQVSLGLFANDELFFEGPLASLVSERLSNRMTSWHELNFNLVLALVAVHVVAVLLYLQRGDNLIVPMLTGRKRGDAVGEPGPAGLRFAPLWLALVVAALAGAAVWGILQLG